MPVGFFWFATDVLIDRVVLIGCVVLVESVILIERGVVWYFRFSCRGL